MHRRGVPYLVHVGPELKSIERKIAPMVSPETIRRLPPQYALKCRGRSYSLAVVKAMLEFMADQPKAAREMGCRTGWRLRVPAGSNMWKGCALCPGGMQALNRRNVRAVRGPVPGRGNGLSQACLKRRVCLIRDLELPISGISPASRYA